MVASPSSSRRLLLQTSPSLDWREFASAIALMSDDPPPIISGGLQLTGPGSAFRLLRDLRDQNFTYGTFHEHWLRAAKISKGDRSTYEHECLSAEYAGSGLCGADFQKAPSHLPGA